MNFADPHSNVEDYCTSESLYRVFAGEAAPRPDDKRWLHGPTLAAWIRENHADLKAQLGADLLRRVKAWKAGSPAEEATAEKVLVKLGGQLVDLPRSLWIEKPKRRPRRKPDEIKAEQIDPEAIGPRTLAALREGLSASVAA